MSRVISGMGSDWPSVKDSSKPTEADLGQKSEGEGKAVRSLPLPLLSETEKLAISADPVVRKVPMTTKKQRSRADDDPRLLKLIQPQTWR